MFLNSPCITSLLLDKDDSCEEDIDNLVYTQIFPYLYVDNTQTKVLSYLCFEVDIPRIPTPTIKDVKFMVWIYCRKDGMNYSKKGYLGTRVDILADMVEQELHDQRKFGIGKLSLESVTHCFPSNEYYGRQMIFTIPDFKVKG